MQVLAEAAARAGMAPTAVAGPAAAAAGVSDEDVISISDSEPSEQAAEDASMDVDAGDSAADQEQDYAQLPTKRSIKPPERFTPAKHPPGKRRGRYANVPSSSPYTKPYQHPALTSRKPGRPKLSKPAAFTPLTVTPAPATPAATAAAIAAAAAGDAAGPEAAAADADALDAVTVATLGLRVAEQYSQLLSELKDLLESLDPSKVHTKPQDLLEELVSLAHHRQQLQQVDADMLDTMGAVLQRLPRAMQKQARLRLLPFSSKPQRSSSPAAAGEN